MATALSCSQGRVHAFSPADPATDRHDRPRLGLQSLGNEQQRRQFIRELGIAQQTLLVRQPGLAQIEASL